MLTTVQTHNDLSVISINARRLDASIALAFKDEVMELIHQGESRILLNLHNIEFIDSSSLGAIVSLLKAMNGRGILALCELNDSVRNMFKLTRMDKVFTIYDTENTALHQLLN